MRRLLPWMAALLCVTIGLLLSAMSSAEGERPTQTPAPTPSAPVEDSFAEDPPVDEALAIEQLAEELSYTAMMVELEANEISESAWGSWTQATTWCETWSMTECSSDRDCGAHEQCVHPWWAKEEEEKVCAEGWPSKSTRQWRRDRLRTIVDFTCSRSRGCDPRQLHGFLSVIALRESTWRPQKRHRLNPDIESAMRAWRRRAKVFADNPYYAEQARWATGLGLYGMNPAIFVDAWDPSAPPEVLCREVEATAAYLERARRAVRGFQRRKISPTLCDVHHAVSGGKIEPCGAGGSKAFRHRAERAGIDPDALVTEKSFGKAPPRDRGARVAWAEVVTSAVEGLHPRKN